MHTLKSYFRFSTVCFVLLVHNRKCMQSVKISSHLAVNMASITSLNTCIVLMDI